MLKKLSAYPRQNGLAKALREVVATVRLIGALIEEVFSRLDAGGNRIRTIGPASGKVVDAKFQRSDPGRSNTDFGRRC